MAKVRRKSKGKRLTGVKGKANVGVSLPIGLTQTPEPTDETQLVKTTPTPKTYSVYLDTQNSSQQEKELLESFLAMAGIELFQYTNSVTIDGMESDVAIINVLSSRRSEYTPNTMIDLYPPWLHDIYLSDVWKPNPAASPVPSYPLSTAETNQALWSLGQDDIYDSLTVDLRGSSEMFSGLVVELYVKQNDLTTSIGTGDYAN